MRIVLDTDVMVAAVRSAAGASRALLAAIARGRGRLLVSVALLLEYEEVLARPEHAGASGWSRHEIAQLLDGVAAFAEPVRIAYLWRPMLNDVDDEMVLETAVNGGADLLVTFNLRDLEPACRRFGIAALRPGTALAKLLETGA